jgi:L-malate glycosyltransferase
MHILIIPSWYKDETQLVLGSFFEEQARSLMKMSHQVGILYPRYFSFSHKERLNERKYVDNDLPTFDVSFKAKIPKNYSVNYKLFQRKIYKDYLDYVKQYGKPDIIHSHTVYYGGIATLYIAKKEKLPFVITEHFTPFITGGISHPYDIKIAKEVFSKANHNIVVSSGFRTLLAEKLKLNEKIFDVVSNMVDEDFFKGPIKETFDLNQPHFFTVSFLSERKNHRLMIEAFRLVVNQIPNALFEIGGDGPILNSLKDKVKELQLQENVFFLGEMSRDGVKRKMQEIDIFLLASTFETFGVVLIEALASGVPVITTDSIGPRDIVNNQNGVIVSNFQKETFAKTIMEMISNYQQYDKKWIREDCHSRFSEQSIMKRIENIYKEIVI